jgi:hypothetical protein
MTRRRYRIEFVARFDQIIIAESLAQAKQIAEDIQAADRIIGIAGAESAWNIIEPLDEVDGSG